MLKKNQRHKTIYDIYIVMLADWGITKPVHSLETLTADITKMNLQMPMGTPAYMPEQQFQGKERENGDTYAMGILLYQLLTGILPFTPPQGLNPMAMLYYFQNAHAKDIPPAFNKVVKDKNFYRDELEAVVRKAIAKDPQYRYQRPGDMQDALRQGYDRGKRKEERNLQIIDMARITNIEESFQGIEAKKRLMGEKIDTPLDMDIISSETIYKLKNLINASIINSSSIQSMDFLELFSSYDYLNYLVKDFVSFGENEYEDLISPHTANLILEILQKNYLGTYSRGFVDSNTSSYNNMTPRSWIYIEDLLKIYINPNVFKQIKPKKALHHDKNYNRHLFLFRHRSESRLICKGIANEWSDTYQESFMAFNTLQTYDHHSYILQDGIVWSFIRGNAFEYELTYKLFGLSRCLIFLEQYEKSIEMVDDLIKIQNITGFTVHPQVWNIKGTALFYLKKYSEALEAYDKAIETNPEYPYAYVGKGNVLHILGRHKEAQEAFQKSKNIKK